MAGSANLRKLYTGLYINMVFLTVRNLFRFVEFTQVPQNSACHSPACAVLCSSAQHAVAAPHATPQALARIGAPFIMKQQLHVRSVPVRPRVLAGHFISAAKMLPVFCCRALCLAGRPPQTRM